MNPDFENFNNFSRLRRLLKLKRHEQPPPGYFNRFSRDVMARIKAGDTGVSFELPIWERLFGVFDIKPVFAGAFGMAVCALLISGVIASENMDKPNSSGLAAISDPSGPTSVAFQQDSTPDFSSSTNPVAPSLFDQFPAVQPKLAADRYLVPNGN